MEQTDAIVRRMWVAAEPESIATEVNAFLTEHYAERVRRGRTFKTANWAGLSVIARAVELGIVTEAEAKKAHNRAVHKARYINAASKKAVRERDSDCRLCGSDEQLEYDHIHAWSDGGANDASNLWMLCKRCNRRKKNRSWPKKLAELIMETGSRGVFDSLAMNQAMAFPCEWDDEEALVVEKTRHWDWREPLADERLALVCTPGTRGENGAYYCDRERRWVVLWAAELP